MSVLDLDGATFRVSLDALPDAPGLAREFLTQLLDLWGIKAEPANDALVALSELVTNAVQVTGRIAGPTVPQPDETVPIVFVTARATWHGLHVEVWDSSPNHLPEIRHLNDPNTESGRGLFIVENLATRWGCYPATQRPGQAPGRSPGSTSSFRPNPSPGPRFRPSAPNPRPRSRTAPSGPTPPKLRGLHNLPRRLPTPCGQPTAIP